MNRADFEAQFPRRWQILKWSKYSETQRKYMIIWQVTAIFGILLFSIDIFMWLTLPLKQYIGLMVTVLLISLSIMYADAFLFITIIGEHYDEMLEQEWDKVKPYMTNSSSFESVLSSHELMNDGSNSEGNGLNSEREEIFESARSIDV